MAINILFEVSAINPTDGTAKVFRLSSASAKSSGVYLDNKTWTPAIKAGPVFDFSVWSGGPTAANISYGSLTVAANRLFDNFDWTKFNFEGAQATIWLGQDGQAFGDYRQIWSGAVGPIERANDRDFSIALFGPDASLKRPLLSATYAGTGNAEGSAALTGTHKPFALGACVNVAPVLVDAVYWIYQYHGYGSCPLTAVYSNALTLGAPKATADTYAALKALTLVPGEWAAAPGLGMFRLGTDPGPVKITADVGTGSTVGAAISTLMQLAGISPARIAASVSGIGGSYALYSEQQATVGDLVRDAALWAGRYLIPDSTGKFHATPHTSSKTATALTDANTMADQVKELVPAAPVWRVRVGHTRVWSPHNVGEISPAVAELAEQSSANAAAAKAAQDAADAAAAEAEYAKQRLLNQASDGILDRTEKLELSRELEAYTAERLGIIAQGNSFGLSAEVAAYTTAYNNLFNYLNGLSPSINDTTADTVINGNFIAFRKDYFVARQNLLEKVPGVTATRAVWATVTGEGKPENNATVGAPVGTHVGGVPVVDVVGAIKDTNGNVLKIVDVKAELASAKIKLDADIATASQAATDARIEAGQARAEAAQVRTDLVSAITDAKEAGTDASAEAATVRDNLAAEVSRAQGAEGTLSTRITTAQGRADGAHTAISEETTQRVSGDTALANRANTVEAKLAGTVDSELAARIRAEETARVNAVSAVANRTATLETSARSSGNMVPNSDLATLDGWVLSHNGIGASTPRIRSDNDYWVLRGESVLYTDRPGNNGDPGNYVEMLSPRFAVQPGTWLQFYALTASHRQRSWVSLFLYSEDGSWHSYAGENFGARVNNGGPDLAGWDTTGLKSFKVPAGALQARLSWRAYGVNNGEENGVAWMFRPFVGRAREGQTEWTPYSPGSSKPQTIATNAKIADEAVTRSTADTALSNRLTTTEAQLNFSQDSEMGRRLNVVDARVSTEETARVSAETALANRVANTEAKLAGSQDSDLAARIRNEETARVNADSSLAGRATSLETSMSRVPETWRVRAAGNASQRPANFGDVGVYAPDGSGQGGYNRSYTAMYFQNGANVIADVHSFDVYGDPNASTAMANYLNNIPAGRTVIVYTSDEPANGRHNNGLPDAMRRCGAGQVFESNQFKLHSAYALIGKAGIGRGGGSEYYAGKVDTDPQAWLDIPFTLVNGRASIGGQAGVAVTSARLDDEIYVRSTADAALSGRTSTIEAQISGAQDSNLAARIREEAVARATADDAIANRTTTLESSARGSGNLLSNTSFATRDGWQTGNNPNNWGMVGINDNGDDWRPAGENALSINEYALHSGNFVEVVSDQFSVTPNEWIQFYCRTSNHRCNAWVSLYFYAGANPAYIEYAGENYSPNRNNGGRSIGGWDYTGLKKIKVPAGATGARMVLRKYATIEGDGHSVAWFTRPFVGPVTDKTDSWMPFVSGTDLAGLRGVTAKITDEATTRASADSALAGRVSTVEANYVTSGTAASIAQGKVNDEATARANADSALANRIATTEAQFRGETDSTIAARIRDEATARANADGATASRIDGIIADYQNRDVTVNGRVDTESSVRANADSALATRASNVEARAGSLESRTGINETAIVDAKNKLAAARLELSAVSPGGRAAITLRSDNNNGAGVDIVGDVNFSGKLNVGATSGARLEIRDNVIKIYDENGALVGKIGNLAL